MRALVRPLLREQKRRKKIADTVRSHEVGRIVGIARVADRQTGNRAGEFSDLEIGDVGYVIAASPPCAVELEPEDAGIIAIG